jgi:hypothetical protein
MNLSVSGWTIHRRGVMGCARPVYARCWYVTIRSACAR